MGIVLADDLPDRQKFFGYAEVGTEAPDDLSVSRDNREKTGLPAADDDVVGCEPPVSFIEPVVRPDIGCRVDMQPVETASRGVDSGRGLDCIAGRVGEAELIDVIAGGPFPDDVAFRRNFDQAVVFELGVGDVRAGCG